ncbi:hypothetical protein Fmac_021582 [Flemingia macrophylla]|uniref:O-methyltransferase n=1 Tax=Flemingia macrophylla TaxID=520843 RepID=A0ABD1LX99_9FABA
MEVQSEERTTKLLGAQTNVWNHIFSFINFMSLNCAIELGIPDIIHNYGQPMPLSQLITSLPIHPSKTSFVYRLMRMLTHSGFFSQQKLNENELEVGYVLTDASILLLKDNPLSMAPFMHAILDPALTNPWHQLPTWFNNDDPSAFHMEHGMKMWDYIALEPKLNHLFNDAMAGDTELVAKMVTDKCKGVFKGLESLVDVGGGTGTMAKAIAQSLPQIECTVFDLPHVVASLQGSANLKYVGGDMFDLIPSADAILLKEPELEYVEGCDELEVEENMEHFGGFATLKSQGGYDDEENGQILKLNENELEVGYVLTDTTQGQPLKYDTFIECNA